MTRRLAAWSFPFLLLCAPGAAAQESPTDVVAAAVREKGYECDDPRGLEADPNDTAPDEEAWIIHCENGAYRVKFVGDRGADVQPTVE